MNNININFSSIFDPYQWVQTTEDKNTKIQKLDQFQLSNGGMPARLSSASLSVGFALPMKSKSSQKSRPGSSFYEENGIEYGLPWSVRFDYSFRYSKTNPFIDSRITQTIRFTGKLDFSRNWKFNFSSGYDFVAKKITYTNIRIERSLHCWNMSFNIIPFGNRKSYTFMINVNANLFKDVKYRKEKSWFDNSDIFK